MDSLVKTILVTGAAGFLGRRLWPRLLAAGHRVVAADRTPGPALEGVTWLASDLSATEPVLAAGAGATALIHLAWDMRREGDRFAPQAAQVEMTARLLDAAAEHGIRRWIGLGSAEEYGRRGGCLAEDAASVGPLTPYGWAKRAAGELAQAKAARAGAGLIWLRPFIVYGPGQRGDMAIPYAYRAACAGARAEFSDALQVRDFVFVDDVVDALLAALRTPEGTTAVVNLCTGQGVVLRSVLEEVGRRWGQPANFVFGARPRRPGEPDEQIGDPSRAADVLGWRARTAWTDGIARLQESA